MHKTVLGKTCLLTASLIFVMTLAIVVPTTSYGDECPLEVDVSPFQVNIDAGGVSHYVRVLTYARYANTQEAFVYVNEWEDEIDDEYIILTRDSLGRLVVKIDLDALKEGKYGVIPFGYTDIKIAVVLKEPIGDCSEYAGVGEVFILGKNGE